MPRLSACSKARCQASVSVVPLAWIKLSTLGPQTIQVRCAVPVGTNLNLLYTGKGEAIGYSQHSAVGPAALAANASPA
jgi:hypothetical protein